jgi:phage-related minor tail protein
MGDSAKDAVTNIRKEVYRLYVVRPMIENLFGPPGSTGEGILGKFLSTGLDALNPNVKGSANGNAFSRGSIIPYADGGVVNRPTFFPMSGNNTGLMGEAGPEAILPLERGSDGKLGVKASSGNSAPVFNMTYNFQGGVTEADLARAMPQMVEQTKRAVVDTVQRGGSIARVFRG